jgi:hypothetical protein
MTTIVVLRNGFRFQGKLLRESDSELVLDEIKNGKMVIEKESIVARSLKDDRDESGKHKVYE